MSRLIISILIRPYFGGEYNIPFTFSIQKRENKDFIFTPQNTVVEIKGFLLALSHLVHRTIISISLLYFAGPPVFQHDWRASFLIYRRCNVELSADLSE